MRSGASGHGRHALKSRAAALAAALAALPSVASARGGGGGHGGGGHSSGGHGSFGHGSFGHGSFGHGVAIGAFSGGFSFIFTLAIIALVFYFVFRASRMRQSFGSSDGPSLRSDDGRAMTIERATYVADQAADAGAALTAMRAGDPDFEPETFMQRAEMTFFLVKRAYQHRDLSGAAPYLVPDLYASWSTGVQKLITDHHRPVLDNLNVRGMHVADATHDPASGDRIVVHFDIVFRGKLLDDRDGRTIADTGDDNRYGERWTFVRSAGAKTVTSGGVVAQKCPNCGAPLELTSDAHCKYCHAQITSGQFDWSVAAMEPAQFTGLALDPLLDQVEMPPDQGLAAIKAADPNFDQAAFLSRVQQAFMTLQDAWQARDVDTGRGFMSPGLYFSWSAQVEQMTEQHRRNVLEGMRVDRITPVRVLHGRVFDDVTVRVDATCADYEVDETTQKIVFGDKTPRPFTEYWTFQRAVSAKTGEHNLLEKVCPNCGAPLQVTQLGECRYCKAAVTSGRFDWVLSRIEQQEEYAAEFAGR